MTARSLWKYDLGFVACVVLLYREAVFGTARVIGRDALHYLIPIGAALREGYLGHGSLLWDSTLNHGLPVAARWSPMVFYPGQWLNAVFQADTALTVGILVHLVIAASAMMRLALRYTDHLPAAWIAGFSYACGGYLISVTVGGGYLFGAALLPLSLLCLHRLAEQASVSRMGTLAAVLALQIFCADPQTLFYEALFVAPLIVFLHRREPNDSRKRVLLAGSAGLIALAIGTAQWLPSSEFSALSVRADGIGAEASGAWALHPLRLIQFFSPHVLGSVTPQNTFWARSLVNSTEFTMPWAPLLYNGLLLWAGMASLDWRRQRRTLWVIAGVTGFFLLMAFGEWGPVFRAVIAVLPGAKFFRYPEKFLVFVTLGICLLGAIGLGRLLEDLRSDAVDARRRRTRIAIAFAVGAAVSAGLRLWLDPDSQARLAWFADVVARQGSDYVEAEVALRIVASSLVHTLVMCALIAVLCFVAHRLRPELMIGVVVVLAVADVLPASLPQRYLADATPYQGTPASCGALPEPEFGLRPLVWRYQPPEIYLRIPTEDEGTRFETEHIRDWQTLRPNTGSQYCIRQVDGYEAARLRTYGRLWAALKSDNERRLRIFGVQNIVSQRGSIDPSRYPFVSGSEQLETEVHRVKEPLPYAHAVGRAESVPSVEAAVQRVAEPSFGFTEAIVLERVTAPEDFQAAPRRAVVRSHRAGEVVIDVDFAAPGYLMLEESHYPGWRAQTDGTPLTVERANAHFLAAQLPAGARTVRFVFDPPVQRRANVISVVGLALLLLLQLAAAGLRWRE